MTSPRKLVATECCIVGLAMAVAVAIVGLTPLSLALLAACALAMTPALLTAGRLERRGGRD